MNAQTISQPVADATGGNYFGDCPHCLKSNGYVNVRSSHYGICVEHKVFWAIGANLFSGWREESEEDWKRNAEMLSGFSEVESVRVVTRLVPGPEPVPYWIRMAASTDRANDVCNADDPPVQLIFHASLDPQAVATMARALAMELDTMSPAQGLGGASPAGEDTSRDC